MAGPRRRDSIDTELAASSRGVRVLVVSLAVLLATGLLQALVAAASGSVALLADTVHNLADAFTAVPLGFAFWLGRRPATGRFTYGYGRAEDLAGVFIVLLIAASAVFAGWEAVRRLIDPAPVAHVWWVVAAGLTSLAVVVGAVGVAVGLPWADPVVGLLITVAIASVMWGAARDVFGRLMDAVDPALVVTGREALSGTVGVASVPELRMRWSGHRLLADAVIEVDPDLTLGDGRALAHRAEENLVRALPKLAQVVVHARPVDARG